MSDVQNAPASAVEGDSVSRDVENMITDNTANPQKPPEAESEGECATASNNERLISALQACFADLAKKNEEQMDK
ncbi:hypothetical protein FB451DRAFT_1411079 [Mycena latifolia]|nr:hypothetical protein FB451DRAFT_1411079 [Mycena latifolia]